MSDKRHPAGTHPPSSANRDPFEPVLQHAEATFDPLPFDADAARAFGQISAAVLAAGRHPRRRLADLMIASIAMVNQLPLYTTNPNDFQGLEQLIALHPVARPAAV